MPLYFNVKSHVARVILADGRSYGFPPRQEVWLAQSDMSADVQALINNRTIVYRGHRDDEQIVKVRSAEPEKELGKRLPGAFGGPVTYSDLQPEYDSKIDRKDEDIPLDEPDGLESIDGGSKRRGRKKRALEE